MTRLEAKRLEISELIANELGFDYIDGMDAADRDMVDQQTDEAIEGCDEYFASPADGEHSNIRLRQLLKQHVVLSKTYLDRNNK
ncbi:hypothetical protein [Methylobacterium sp. CM6247]